jgi:hypothetical protein
VVLKGPWVVFSETRAGIGQGRRPGDGERSWLHGVVSGSACCPGGLVGVVVVLQGPRIVRSGEEP